MQIYVKNVLIFSKKLVSLKYWKVSNNLKVKGIPGGSVVETPPADAGDTGSIPGPGRSHMLWSNQACAPQLLGLCSGAQELQLLSPPAANAEPPHPRALLPNKKSRHN